MGPQPRVDAGHVKPVPTLREHPDLVAVGEFGQANRALRCHHPLIGAAVNVGKSRERLQHLLLETLVGQGPGGGGGGAGSPAEPGAAGDSDEADDAYEGAEESGENNDEVGLDGDGLGWGSGGGGDAVERIEKSKRSGHDGGWG